MDRTNYDATYFLTLRADMATTFNAQYPRARAADDARNGIAGSGFWYFDQTNDRLYLSLIPYVILSQTANSLHIRSVFDTRSNGTGSLHTTNYRFTK